MDLRDLMMVRKIAGLLGFFGFFLAGLARSCFTFLTILGMFALLTSRS
jgi:hypothetical protein